MDDIYRACAAVLKPGGFLVCVTKDMRSGGGGALRNLSGETIALCEDAGLVYWQRVISLLATVRDSELVMRPSFWQTLHARRRRAQGDRTQVVAHEDVLRVPQAPDGSNQRTGSPNAEGGLRMPVAAPETGERRRRICHFGGSIDSSCQGLEITKPIWSDRSQRCATHAGHTEPQQPRPTAVRHPAQSTHDHANGGACGTGA